MIIFKSKNKNESSKIKKLGNMLGLEIHDTVIEDKTIESEIKVSRISPYGN